MAVLNIVQMTIFPLAAVLCIDPPDRLDAMQSQIDALRAQKDRKSVV